jgi:hypothetical protein
MTGRFWKASLLAVAVLFGVQSGPVPDEPVYSPDLSGADRLLTNEYAHSNPGDDRAVRSTEWDVTSGSLFVRDGAGWTGPPDAASPDVSSANGTGSSVFRVTTRRHDFLNALVSLRVKNLGLTSQGRIKPAATDGIHIFLRWQSPEDLYVASLNRRDNQILIKRKSPGGDVNGGTYATLGQASYTVPYGEWQDLRIWIANTAEDTVTISVSTGERTLLKVVDRGTQAPASLSAGAIGLRGDNCDFQFDRLRVRHLP